MSENREHLQILVNISHSLKQMASAYQDIAESTEKMAGDHTSHTRLLTERWRKDNKFSLVQWALDDKTWALMGMDTPCRTTTKLYAVEILGMNNHDFSSAWKVIKATHPAFLLKQAKRKSEKDQAGCANA